MTCSRRKLQEWHHSWKDLFKCLDQSKIYIHVGYDGVPFKEHILRNRRSSTLLEFSLANGHALIYSVFFCVVLKRGSSYPNQPKQQLT